MFEISRPISMVGPKRPNELFKYNVPINHMS